MATEAKTTNYWISNSALYIQLNATGEPNRIQASVVSGASILCYMQGIDGLGYDAGHNYQRWTLAAYPSEFPSDEKRYVYVAIPRKRTSDNDIATIVFPSQKIDIYGKAIVLKTDEDGKQEEVVGDQIGSEDYYYIYLQGIISEVYLNEANDRIRRWVQDVDFGSLSTDEALASGGVAQWWKYNSVSDTISFLKEIFTATFNELVAKIATIKTLIIGGSELTGVANADTPADSTDKIVTPAFLNNYGGSQYLFKIKDDVAHGIITFMRGLLLGDGSHSISESGDAVLGDVVVDRIHDAASTPADRVIIGAKGFDLYIGEDGKSHAYIDDLVVRQKFFASSAEIRKISYSGGTTVFSNAGSTLAKVSAVFDSHGECVAYKCYACADDGTTKTMNWWHVGMMALCQTFNVKAGKSENLQNRYYWRLVVGVGQETLEDGKLYDYVVLSNKKMFLGSDSYVPTYTDKVIADENDNVLIFGDYGIEVTTDGGMGSMAGVFYEQEGKNTDDGGNLIANRVFYGYEDINGFEPDAPSAGDVIVQVGDQICWKSRGNVIKLSTSTEDNATDNAPSIAMYHNVGALYSTGEKDGNGKDIVSPYQWKTCTCVISPEMELHNAKNFKWFTESPDKTFDPVTVVYQIETTGMFRVGSDGKLYGDNKFQGSDENRFISLLCYRTVGDERNRLGDYSCFWETNYPDIFSIAASPYNGGVPLLLTQDKVNDAPSSVLVSCYSLAIDPTTHAPSKGDVLYASVNIPIIRDGQKGEDGEKGDKGDDGAPGTPGTDGKDAVSYSISFNNQKVQIGTDTYEERIYVYVTKAVGSDIQTSVIYNAGTDFNVYVDGVEAAGLKSVLKVNGYIGRSAWSNAQTFQVNLYDGGVLVATGSYSYGQKGDKGDDGDSGLEIVISPTTLVYDTDDDGIVTDYSQSAIINCNKGGARYANVTYSVYGTLNCQATYSGGTIKITSINKQTLTYTENGETKTMQVSQSAGYVAMRVVDNATGLNYYPQLNFTVNVSKFTGSMVANNKKFQTQFTEISNKYDNLPLKNQGDLTKYTSSIEQTARQISLSVGATVMGRRNLLVGSEFKRFDDENMVGQGQTVACRLRTGDRIDGYNSCRIVSESTNQYYNGVIFKKIRVDGNTQYTLTTMAKRLSDVLGSGCYAIIHEFLTKDATSAGYQQSWFLLTTDDAKNSWVQKSHTFTTQSDTRYINVIFCVSTSGSFSICKPMLERGESFSGYSLSEFDYEYVGGNLIDNSRFLKAGGTLLYVQDSVSQELGSDYAIATATASGSSSKGVFCIKKTLKAGVDYVLSWYIKRTGGDENGQCIVNFGRKILYSERWDGTQAVNSVEGGHSPYSGYQGISNVPTEWARMWVHFRLSEDWTDDDNLIYIQLYGGSSSLGYITAQFSRPKLEEGAYSTEWTDKSVTMVDEGKLANQLLATGVDIVNKQVTVTADNFKVRNNSGVETMMVNKDGTINAAMIVAQRVQTLGSNGQRIVLDDGLFSVYGLAGMRNWLFGLDENKKATLSYYDDDGNKLYDLGPDGISKVKITQGTFTSGIYVNAATIGLTVSSFNNVSTNRRTSTSAMGEVSVTETIFSSTDDDTKIFVKLLTTKTLGEQFSKTTLYLYRAPRVNDVIQADTDHKLNTQALAQQADGKYFTSQNICNGTSLQNLASGCYFNAGNKVMDNSKFLLVSLGEFDSIRLAKYFIQAPISITFGAKSLSILGQIKSREQYTQLGSAGSVVAPIEPIS